MFPFKRFIQGPNLHEESIELNAANFSQPPQPQTKTISGEQAKKMYEEIISSTSSKNNRSAKSSRNNKNNSSDRILRSVHKPTKKEQAPNKILTLNQLMRSCETDNVSELEEYLESCSNDFDINEQDIYGWTLLMSAACAGANASLKLLLRYGSSSDLCDKKGLKAFDHAKKNGRKEAASILEEWEQVGKNALVFFAADFDESDEMNKDPVFCEACCKSFLNQKEHIKSIAHLLSSGQMGSLEGGKVHYGIPESNRGFQMMLKTGWNKKGGLGPEGQGNKFPIKTVMKRDREGVGNEKDKKAARITHFDAQGAVIKERDSTIAKREEERRKNSERRKEIRFRRQLNTL